MERFRTPFEQQILQMSAIGYPTLANSFAFIHVFLSEKFY
jgi:hypothetical protein